MKYLLLPLALTISTAAFASSTFQCEGREGVRGKITVTLNQNGSASVKGSYNWDEQSGEDTKTHDVDCKGKENNAGQSGVKTHDYYNLSKGCQADYLRASKDLVNADNGWVSLVVAGPAEEDSSGYTYANFFCK
jgi:hypothetical protein